MFVFDMNSFVRIDQTNFSSRIFVASKKTHFSSSLYCCLNWIKFNKLM